MKQLNISLSKENYEAFATEAKSLGTTVVDYARSILVGMTPKKQKGKLHFRRSNESIVVLDVEVSLSVIPRPRISSNWFGKIQPLEESVEKIMELNRESDTLFLEMVDGSNGVICVNGMTMDIQGKICVTTLSFVGTSGLATKDLYENIRDLHWSGVKEMIRMVKSKNPPETVLS